MNFNAFDQLEAETSSSDEDFNPFKFTYQDQPYHSFERVFLQHFEIKENKSILVSREKFMILKQAMKKLKKWVQIVQKEHTLYNQLLQEHTQATQKLQEHQMIINNIEIAAHLKIDQFKQDNEKLKNKINNMNATFEQTKEDFEHKLQEKEKIIAKQQRSIQLLIDSETELQETIQKLKQELLDTNKEFKFFKNLKNITAISSKDKGQKISTLELVFATKVKNTFLRFFDIPDTLTLMKTSKRFYFSLIQPKICIPHFTQLLNLKLFKENKTLTKLQDQYQKLFQQVQDQELLKSGMAKIYEFRINISDVMTPIIKEIQNFIEGKQIFGTSPIPNNQTGMQIYLQQQSQLYIESLKELKKSKFPWESFFTKINTDLVLLDRSRINNKLQVDSQQLTQRLHDLGSVASSDPGLFSMYMTQLQRNLAQLFTFSLHLMQECNQMQSICYYLMREYLQQFKVKKNLEERFEDTKEQIGVYQDAKEFLNERLKDMEKRIVEYEERILKNTKMNQEKEKQLEQQQLNQNNQKKVIGDQQEKMKILAKELVKLRKKHKDLKGDYNELISKFQNLSNAMKELEYNG